MFLRSRTKGAKRIDVSELRGLFRDNRFSTSLGVVTQFDGETSHFDLEGDDVLVDVELAPGRERVFCRLGAIAGGAGRGVWAIPPVGTEVAVLVPRGELGMDPVIVATLSTGQLPADLTDDTILVVANQKIHVHATAGDAIVEASGNTLLGSASASHAAVWGDNLKTATDALGAAMGTLNGILVAASVAYADPIAGLPSSVPPPTQADGFHVTIIGALVTAIGSLSSAITNYKTAVDAALSSNVKVS
jgi:hypothetical protein